MMDASTKIKIRTSTSSADSKSLHSLSSSMETVVISKDLGASTPQEESSSLPYKIVAEIEDPDSCFFRSASLSECWIAARDLKQGETIFTDTEASIVLQQNANPLTTYKIMSRKFPYSHSCRPNCRADTFHDGLDSNGKPKRGITAHELLAVKRGIVILRTLVPISKGQKLTVAHPGVHYPLLGTRMRLSCMREYSNFLCTCSHCADPTEGGSMFSAVPCQKCKRKNNVNGKMETVGYLLPVNPLDLKDDAVWKCGSGCGAEGSQLKCIGFTWTMYEILQAKPWSRSDNCKLLEEIVENADKLEFHPNHWIVVMATFLLMRRQSYILQEIQVDKENIPLENSMKREQVENLMTFIRRLEYLLSVREKTTPGWTSRKGGSLWMLWRAKFFMANRFTQEELKKDQNKLTLALAETKESLEILKEAVTIRMFDFNPYEAQKFSKIDELFQAQIKAVEKRIENLELKLENFKLLQTSENTAAVVSTETK